MFLLLLLFLLGNFSTLCGECPPFSGPVAQFCNMNVRDQLCVNGQIVVGAEIGSLVFGTLSAAPEGQVVPSFGNTIRVDQVYGDDATGAKNGLPFLTIGSALEAASAGDFVWIFPGNYNEILIIPDGVAVRGVSASVVTIQNLNVTAATDLVTMGENTRLEDVSLQLTSGQQVNLRGIVFPGTTSVTSQWVNSSLLVDNSAAGAGTSNVYGIHSIGTGFPSIEISAARTTSITVNSTGSGVKRGILIDTANGFNVNDTDILVTGGTDSIGVETNNAGAAFAANSSNISGDLADISQTLGSISLTSTNLLHSQANGLGFFTPITPGGLLWADPSEPLTSEGNPIWMRPGTSVSDVISDVFIPVSQKILAKSLAVNAAFAPGIGESTTWTIRRDSGTGPLDTPLTVTLTNDQEINVNSNISVHFDQGDVISIRVDMSPGANTSDVVVTMDTY